jgi:hypothetical protein
LKGTTQEKAMGNDNEQLDARGLPIMDKKSNGGSIKTIVLVLGATTLISAGAAYSIHYYFVDSTVFDKKIDLIKSQECQWIYASAWIFSKLVQSLNMIPMAFKSKIMTEKSGNLRANMILYRSLNKKDESLIGMETEGAVGEYNRANRSLHHFVESSAGFLLGFALAAYAFPKPAFCAMSAFCAGRFLHQLGYSKGYGSHGAGFVLSMIASTTIDGLNLFVAGKGFGFI